MGANNAWRSTEPSVVVFSAMTMFVRWENDSSKEGGEDGGQSRRDFRGAPGEDSEHWVNNETPNQTTSLPIAVIGFR